MIFKLEYNVVNRIVSVYFQDDLDTVSNGKIMNAQGIRILDKINRVVSVKLQDILEEINQGDHLNWSILYFYGMAHLKGGKSVLDFEKEAIQSEKGIFMKWNELRAFADTIDQLFGILIIGCNDLDKVARYKNDKEMYESCDIVIHMIDSCCWEVFSKDKSLIQRLATKFKDIKYLTDYSFLQ